ERAKLKSRSKESTRISSLSNSRKRQWGADNRRPLPSVTERSGPHAVAFARLAILTTVGAWLAFVLTTAWRAVTSGGISLTLVLEAGAYIGIVSLLCCSSLAYLACRVGFLNRVRDHRRTPRAELDAFYATHSPTLSVLVPAFREEARIIRKTLLS